MTTEPHLITDPIDADLSDSSDDPVLIRGIGYSGKAEQRVEYLVDPQKQAYNSLHSAIACGDDISRCCDVVSQIWIYYVIRGRFGFSTMLVDAV